MIARAIHSAWKAKQSAKLTEATQFVEVTLPNPLALVPPTKMAVELPGGIRIRFVIPDQTEPKS